MNDLPTRFQTGSIADVPAGVITRMKHFMELADLPMITWNLKMGGAFQGSRILRVNLHDGIHPAENYYFACNEDGTLTEILGGLPVARSSVITVQVQKTDFEYLVRNRKNETRGEFLDRTTPLYVNSSSSYQPSRWVYGSQVASLGAASAGEIVSVNNSFYQVQKLDEGRGFVLFVEWGWPPFRPGSLPLNGQLVNYPQFLTKLTSRTTADATYLPDTNASYARTNDVLYIDQEDNPLVYHSFDLTFWGTTYSCYDYISSNPFLDIWGLVVTRYNDPTVLPLNPITQEVTNCYIYAVNLIPYGDPVSQTDRYYAGAKSPWGIVSFLNSVIRYGGKDYTSFDISSTNIPVNELLNSRFALQNKAIEFTFLESGGN